MSRSDIIITIHEAPCQNCKDRKVTTENGKPRTCHSTCEKYLNYKAKLNADEDKRREKMKELEFYYAVKGRAIKKQAQNKLKDKRRRG